MQLTAGPLPRDRTAARLPAETCDDQGSPVRALGRRGRAIQHRHQDQPPHQWPSVLRFPYRLICRRRILSSPQPFQVKDVVLAGAYDLYGRGRVSNFLKSFNLLNMHFIKNTTPTYH